MISERNASDALSPCRIAVLAAFLVVEHELQRDARAARPLRPSAASRRSPRGHADTEAVHVEMYISCVTLAAVIGSGSRAFVSRARRRVRAFAAGSPSAQGAPLSHCGRLLHRAMMRWWRAACREAAGARARASGVRRRGSEGGHADGGFLERAGTPGLYPPYPGELGNGADQSRYRENLAFRASWRCACTPRAKRRREMERRAATTIPNRARNALEQIGHITRARLDKMVAGADGQAHHARLDTAQGRPGAGIRSSSIASMAKPARWLLPPPPTATAAPTRRFWRATSFAPALTSRCSTSALFQDLRGFSTLCPSAFVSPTRTALPRAAAMLAVELLDLSRELKMISNRFCGS